MPDWPTGSVRDSRRTSRSPSLGHSGAASTSVCRLRPAVAQLDRDAERAKARAAFGLDPDRPTLLVSGGSQGSRRLNEATAGAARALADAGCQVLHATGPANTVKVQPRPDDPPYVVVPYLEHMELGYAAADLMLCRAGANTCAELAAVGLPARLCAAADRQR